MSEHTDPLSTPDDQPIASPQDRELVLISGISGSGKSVALHALEDVGYFCVDNLPPELLRNYMQLQHPRYVERVAIAVDARAARSLPALDAWRSRWTPAPRVHCRRWCR
jgi:UPF0042 nucleotide-binding protein